MKDISTAALVLSLVLLMILSPFLLIIGVNFILGAASLTEIPYTIGSWFGAMLIAMVLKGSSK